MLILSFYMDQGEERPYEHTAKSSHLQARKRALTRNQIDQYFDFGFPVLQNCEKYISVVEAIVFMIFYYGNLS